MKKGLVICIALVLGLSSALAGSEIGLASPPMNGAATLQEQQEKIGKQESRDQVAGVPVLWQEPVDIESRDLFYGIGGRKGAPDLADKFLFIRRDPGGTSEKASVEDSKDRKWTVKFGQEPRSETTASRLVWAVGYHTDQDYFVERVHILRGGDGFDAGKVRFERDDDGFKKVGRWGWKTNPFVGTREFEGLKTLMALLNNFDLKESNNKIVRAAKKKASEEVKWIYYVNDLGATLGSTGYWLTGLPIIGELPSGTKGIAEEFARQHFIEGVRDGKVIFHMQRRRAKRQIGDVNVEHARWMGELLGRLSDKQISDAFRAGGFNQAETAIYLGAIRQRIDQLRRLQPNLSP